MGPLRASAAVLLLCAAAATARGEGDEDAARLHFQVGQSYYDEANYGDALKEFREAYRLSKRPALLYNVALCHERLDQFDQAIAALERYLADEPQAQDRKLIEARIGNLRQRQQARTAPAPPPATVTPMQPAPTMQLTPPEVAPRRKRLYTWIVGGVGLGLLGGALGTGIASQLTFNTLSANCPGARCDAATYPQAQSDINKGRTLSVVTDVLWPLGLVAEGVATALYFLEGRSKKPSQHADVVPIFLPSGAGLALSARWR
ncbi:MAG TPA: tetratricopeptide repeat protein [Polyangia bacterium]|nr:tetratricopeptide repeat protein [Polyangia bacterium]